MIAVAMLALAVAGGLHPILVFLFAVLMVVAWKLEGSHWQLSERTGLVIVLLSVPLFFVDWYFQKAMGEAAGRPPRSKFPGTSDCLSLGHQARASQV